MNYIELYICDQLCCTSNRRAGETCPGAALPLPSIFSFNVHLPLSLTLPHSMSIPPFIRRRPKLSFQLDIFPPPPLQNLRQARAVILRLGRHFVPRNLAPNRRVRSSVCIMAAFVKGRSGIHFFASCYATLLLSFCTIFYLSNR